MKKIVPFNNVLEFNTDVKEITAISLEHNINKYPDMISGVFYISGEYKIAEGLLDKEQFNFELPFDIALSNNYRTDSLLVDVDDFRYDLISDKSLKVNIDLFIDGEIEEPLEVERPEELIFNQESFDFLDRENEEETSLEEELQLSESKQVQEEYDDFFTPEEKKELCDKNSETKEPEREDLLKEMLSENEENDMINNSNINENINTNIFEPTKEEKYVTYRVYKVEETDNVDTIINKYGITKEMLADYNDIENIKPGDKLVIPTNEK